MNNIYKWLTCINNMWLRSPTGNPTTIKAIEISCIGEIFKVFQMASIVIIPGKVSAYWAVVAFVSTLELIIDG